MQILQKIITKLGISDVIPEVVQTQDLKNGDYTTNVAMVLAKQLKRHPLEIAEEIVNKLSVISHQSSDKKPEHSTDQSGQTASSIQVTGYRLQDIEKIEIAPPGFINFFLSASALSTQLSRVIREGEGYGIVKSSVVSRQSSDKKKIMVEFAHPNTHKAFHIGHLRNISIGESLVRLFESQGNQVIRSNYQGDVGMHIAKCLYGILQTENFKLKTLNSLSITKKVELLGKAYATGSQAYETNEAAKKKIHDLNFLIYASAQKYQQEKGIRVGPTDYLKFVEGRKEDLDEVYVLWKETRQWSLDYYEQIYKRMNTHFDRLYFESECLVGVDEVKEAMKKGVLKESEGAIIFDGKPYGLDTRVFVNNMGLPTYEGKELALAKKEFSEFGKLDKLIHVVGPEQSSFFKVTFKVEELLGLIDKLDRQKHLVYGWVRLKHGKMSSRLGNVVTAEQLLNEVKKAVYDIILKSESKDINQTSVVSHQSSEIELDTDEIAETVAVAAVKYSFLKVGTNQEIAFDIEESINLNGDSGPYLLYTYARAKSVLRKAEKSSVISHQSSDDFNNKTIKQYNNEENLVLRLIYRFPEIVEEAAQNYAPNILCKYLFDLASDFNTFYNKHSILGDKKQVTSEKTENGEINLSPITSHLSQFRLNLTAATAQVLQNGLYLLGIATLERM